MLSSWAPMLADQDRRGSLGHELSPRSRAWPAARLSASASPRDRGEPADHYRRDQQHDQLDEVLRVGDRQLVARLDEEEVQREHPEHRGNERRQLPATDRDQQHREQIQAPQAGVVGRRRLEQRNAGGGAADRDEDLSGRHRAAPERGPVERPRLPHGPEGPLMQPRSTERASPVSRHL
jgi:hypothetical protein